MQDALFSSPDPVIDEALQELASMAWWPYDPAKDRVLLYDLRDSYPQLDLIEEIRGWKAWMLDHDQKKEVKPRARLRNWCKYATRPRASRRPGAASASIGRGGPAKAADFGPGGQLEDW